MEWCSGVCTKAATTGNNPVVPTWRTGLHKTIWLLTLCGCELIMLQVDGLDYSLGEDFSTSESTGLEETGDSVSLPSSASGSLLVVVFG
jgi:hypothetical protein